MLMSPPFTSHAERRAFMCEYAQLFDAWTLEHPDQAPYHPEDRDSDYPEDDTNSTQSLEQDGGFDALVAELIRTWPERWAKIREG